MLLEKFFYGLTPVCLSAWLLVETFRGWGRPFARRPTAWAAGLAMMLFAVVVDTAIFLILRQVTEPVIALAWRPGQRTISWGSGEVTIPPNFHYEKESGIDSVVGKFISPDGKTIISYDIGWLTGEHGGMGKTESLKLGSRVRESHIEIAGDDKGAPQFIAIVAFPDNGCANFRLDSTNKNDFGAMDLIANSFQPSGWTPAWLRPFLPEFLRSDCRYRLRWPGL